MEAYLDNSATTCCYEEVAELTKKIMLEDYGNPSSMHTKGVEAEKYLRRAQDTLAGILKVKPQEIFFTSGGTESNNWALFGTAMSRKRRGRRIITTSIEHSAIAAPAAALEELGYEIVRLPVDREGCVSMEDLKAAMTEDTILVSVMMVNNEIGAVEPVAEIGGFLRENYPECYFHVDAIQAFGKYRILPKRMKIDMLSVSGHKIHGPKGSGFLYVDQRVRISPIIYGGGQQGGMRSGTDNVPGAAGLALAAEKIYSRLDTDVEYMYELKEHLAKGLLAIEDVKLHGSSELRSGAPHILNASFLGVRSEVLLHTLEDRGIYVSAGSACSSHRHGGSATMEATRAGKAETESSVRFSFSELTTTEEIDYALQVLREVLPQLRRFTRK
uniref:cysteine desulfurase family protein n=1 Tax=Eubacterium cellulosolvens TaxID=29322 RepID=UPI000483C126|nr:cysteine desulfurase family protein [[Eubacterium] cellulosolvens]